MDTSMGGQPLQAVHEADDMQIRASPLRCEVSASHLQTRTPHATTSSE